MKSASILDAPALVLSNHEDFKRLRSAHGLYQLGRKHGHAELATQISTLIHDLVDCPADEIVREVLNALSRVDRT